MISSLSFKVMCGYARVGNSPFSMAYIVLEWGVPYSTISLETKVCAFSTQKVASHHIEEKGEAHVYLLTNRVLRQVYLDPSALHQSH